MSAKTRLANLERRLRPADIVIFLVDEFPDDDAGRGTVIDGCGVRLVLVPENISTDEHTTAPRLRTPA